MFIVKRCLYNNASTYTIMKFGIETISGQTLTAFVYLKNYPLTLPPVVVLFLNLYFCFLGSVTINIRPIIIYRTIVVWKKYKRLKIKGILWLSTII